MAKRRYSTTTLPAILALRDQGLNWIEIAERLNVSTDTLRSAMSLLGIKGAVQAKTAQYPVREWVQRLALGDTVPEIASSHGLSRMAVYGVLRHRGLPTTCSAAIKAGRSFLPAADAAGMPSARRSVTTRATAVGAVANA